MALDLANKNDVEQRHDSGTRVPITDETGKIPDTYEDESGTRQESYVLMAGIYSSRYRRAREKQEARKFDGKITEGKFTDDGRALVVACVLDWKGVVHNGQVLECTPHNVRAIFDAFPWVFRACDEAMNEPRNFLPAS